MLLRPASFLLMVTLARLLSSAEAGNNKDEEEGCVGCMSGIGHFIRGQVANCVQSYQFCTDKYSKCCENTFQCTGVGDKSFDGIKWKCLPKGPPPPPPPAPAKKKAGSRR